MLELVVQLVMLERNDWDAIAQLQAKTVDGVVNQDHILQVYVFDNSQVLDVNIISCFDTAIPIESMLEKFSSWVNIVKNDIGIPLVRCSEDHYLIVLVHLLEHFLAIRTYVETCVDNFARCCIDLKPDVWRLIRILLSHTVREGLVQVKE